MVIAAPKQSSTQKRLSIIDRGKCWARQLIQKKPQPVAAQATILPPQNEYLSETAQANTNFIYLPQMANNCMCCNCMQNISPISVKPLKITYLRSDDRNMAPISTSTPRNQQYTINLPPPTINPPPPPTVSSTRGSSLKLKRSFKDNMSTIDEDGYLVPTEVIRFNMRRNEFKTASTPCNPNMYVDMDNFGRASRRREIKRTRSSNSKSPLKSKINENTIGTTSSNSLAISPPDIPPPPIPYSTASPSSTSSSTSISNSSISTVSSITPFFDDNSSSTSSSAAVNKLSIILNDLILNSTSNESRQNDKFDDIRRNLNDFNDCRKYSSKQIDFNFNSSTISESNSEDPLIYIDSPDTTHENCSCQNNQNRNSMDDIRKHWNNFKKQNLMCIKPPEDCTENRNIQPSPWIFQNLSSSSSFVYNDAMTKSTENCRNHDYHLINDARHNNNNHQQSRFEFRPSDASYDKSWENTVNTLMINGNMIINPPARMPPPLPTTQQIPTNIIRDDHKHLISFDDSKDADLILNENYNSSLESKSLNSHSMKSSNISEMDPYELEDINEFWYQPNISRHTVQEILISLDIGAFLIRHSNSCKDCFALSIRVPYFANITGVAHYLITRNENGYKLKGVDKEFKSLRSLVTHYSVMQEILPVTLNLNFSTTSLQQVPTSRSTPNTIKYRFDTLNMIK